MYEWSDWTQEEFAERMLGYQAPENLESIPRKHFDNAAPSHIDFREEGKVTPVKNQGQCGSCWAFSATGAMEGMWMNSHSTLYSLSEQQMVDCGQGSCNGGYMDSAWQTVRNGANTEADYPYEARDGQCRAKSNSFVATNSGSRGCPTQSPPWSPPWPRLATPSPSPSTWAPPSSTTAVASSATLSASTDSSTTVSSLSAMTMAPTGSSRTPGVAAGERVATSG